MTLRDQIALDNDIFFNLDEFGETHNIDGHAIECVFDSGIDSQSKDEFGGVYIPKKTLYIKEADMSISPKPGKKIAIDGKPYQVLDISQEMGIVRITVTGGGTI